ncbi:hypothetical protein [Flavobacterium sp.]|uniref:hypothetical protein n=1 Tax=Flavobacterium sp. TaxID=239 RepID=UPI00375143BF
MLKNYFSFIFIFLLLANTTFSQEKKIKTDTLTTRGSISITNNGMSLIPTFSLGKPATVFDFSIQKNRFSFDPQFRFALEDAKPWSFVFWMRYKLITSKKFKVAIGAHPAFIFQTTPAIVNGIQKDLITTKRFFAGELVPTYVFNKKISLGFYYLYSHGLADATNNTNFISMNGYFSNIKVFSNYTLKFAPQIYFLKMDTKDGFYVASSLTLEKKHFPFSIASIVNNKIRTSIVSKPFIWNVSLIYSFGGKYVI